MATPPAGRPRITRQGVEAIFAPLLLVLLAFLVFGEGGSHKFTNWDDWKYIVENPLVHALTPARIAAAFSGFHVYNYNPLHLISYMVDCEIWGLRGGGFFLTNLVLHTAATVLVYFFARNWLGSARHAFLVAGFFLAHPTRVESVAWLSERKDVLSGAFAAAALWCHGLTLPRPGDGSLLSPRSSSRGPTIGALLFYVLALLSKSQWVALPVLLVALDLAARRSLRESLLSKAPHVVLAAGFSLLTLAAHSDEGARGVSFPESLVNPLAALPRYVSHIFWPVQLSPYYDFSTRELATPAAVACGALLLALACAVAWKSWNGRREWFLGAVWFLACLAPVLGIVRINIQVADRYLYFALLGVSLPLAAAIARSRHSAAAFWVGCVLLAGASFETWRYVPTFRDSEQLWLRVLSIDPDCSIAHSNYGAYLREVERWDEAARQYDLDLAEKPYFEESFTGRAFLHVRMGEHDAAAELYRTLLQKKPTSVSARVDYADLLDQVGRPAEALEVLLAAPLQTRDAVFHCKLHDLLLALGREGEALEALETAARLDPYDPRVPERRAALERRRRQREESGSPGAAVLSAAEPAGR